MTEDQFEDFLEKSIKGNADEYADCKSCGSVADFNSEPTNSSPKKRTKVIRLITKYASAAVFALCLGLGTHYLMVNDAFESKADGGIYSEEYDKKYDKHFEGFLTYGSQSNWHIAAEYNSKDPKGLSYYYDIDSLPLNLEESDVHINQYEHDGNHIQTRLEYENEDTNEYLHIETNIKSYFRTETDYIQFGYEPHEMSINGLHGFFFNLNPWFFCYLQDDNCVIEIRLILKDDFEIKEIVDVLTSLKKVNIE